MNDYAMVAGIRGPGVSLEIRDYVFDPADGLEIIQPKFVIGFSLTSLPQPSQGRYLLDHGRDFTDIGPITFSPANVPWCVRTGSGRFRTITCEYAADKFRSVTGRGDDWNALELRACQDIHSARIAQTLKRLAEEAVAPGFATEILTEVLGVSLLVDLSRYIQGVGGSETRGGLHARQLRHIEDYISGLSGARPGLSDLAQLCGMSNHTFMRRFKASTGQTVSAFVQEHQLSKAKILLTETSLPLKEVSFRLGFSNPSDFSFSFRRAVGQSPGQFRRMLGRVRH